MRFPDASFWAGQRVLLTGHTGFKGSWASLWLERLGAKTIGIALPPDQEPDLFSQLAPFRGQESYLFDIAERAAVVDVFQKSAPTLVLHMAAQPLVRRSYAQPVETFATNVMGTAHVLEAARVTASVRAILIVTTDKVYANAGTGARFREQDRLGGTDPYAASKVAAEHVAQSYSSSFFRATGVPVATARAGNVIGGGDWSEDRLIPDIWRAKTERKPVTLRYPHATRPWQHVLDPLLGYFLFLERLVLEGDKVPCNLNFGPARPADSLTVAEVVEAMNRSLAVETPWACADGIHPPEAPSLALDASLAIETLDWQPRLDARTAIEWTAQWFSRYDSGEDMRLATMEQINRYEEL